MFLNKMCKYLVLSYVVSDVVVIGNNVNNS